MSQKHKSKKRRRPDIQNVQRSQPKDCFRNCIGPGCKNVVARESGRMLCSRCKS